MTAKTTDLLAIIVSDCEEARKIRDEVLEANLFDRFSFNIELENYWIYLKSDWGDKIESLRKIIDKYHCRLVKYSV